MLNKGTMEWSSTFKPDKYIIKMISLSIWFQEPVRAPYLRPAAVQIESGQRCLDYMSFILPTILVHLKSLTSQPTNYLHLSTPITIAEHASKTADIYTDFRGKILLRSSEGFGGVLKRVC